MRRLLILIRNVLSIPYRLLFTHVSAFAAVQDSKIDRKAAICKKVRFYRSTIGKYSYVGIGTFVTNCEIGSFSSIAGNCYIGGTAHPTDWVSTSSVFYRWENILKKNFSDCEFPIFSQTYIGNDVWIGEGCKIKAGITIGDGAVIGMGSVVTKDVEPYGIYAGNPARLIRYRFDENTIAKMIQKQWWNWDDATISANAHLFNNPSAFIQKE